MSSKCVRRGDTRYSFAYRFTLQCDTICRAFGLCSSIPIVIWCDCLPASCFVVSFSYWTCQMSAVSFQVFRFDSEVWTTETLRTRRERNGAPHAGLVYNRVVAWVVWRNLCFFVWYFVMTVMSSFWRYLFVGIALMVWQRSWPVGSYHCIRTLLITWQWAMPQKEADLRHYLHTIVLVE